MSKEMLVSKEQLVKIRKQGLSPIPTNSAEVVKAMVSPKFDGEVSIYFSNEREYLEALKIK